MIVINDNDTGEIFIHTLPSSRSALEDPPSISEVRTTQIPFVNDGDNDDNARVPGAG